MSDLDPELTPEQEARVRSLLAEARPDPRREALPAEVAARLDFVLSDLAGQPLEADASDPGAPGGSLTQLAARRRRRVGGLLLAAAAVAVAAVGVGQVVDVGGGSGGDASSAESSAVDSGEAPDRSAVEGADDGSDAGAGDSLSSEEAERDAPGVASEDLAMPSAPLAAVVRVRVREKQFSEDAAAVRRALGSMTAREEFAAPAPSALPDELRTKRVFECAATDLGTGTWVAVAYGGSPAVLVFRRAAGEAQVAELVQCGSGEILRSTTLPARAPR